MTRVSVLVDGLHGPQAETTQSTSKTCLAAKLACATVNMHSNITSTETDHCFIVPIIESVK